MPQLKFVLKKFLLISLSVLMLLAAFVMAFKDKISLGAEAFLYGYPLVIMEVTRVHSSHYIGPENQLRRVRQFPDASFKDVVRPNVDTLYTTAFFSMKEGPWVFEMPANSERYELMPFMDAWTHVFASPGTRTSGSESATFLLVGPSWQGDVPNGMTLLRSPTDMVWLIGRTQTNGTADFETVHRLQDRLHLKKLSSSGHTEKPSPWQASSAASTPPIVQMRNMGTSEFLNRLMALMVNNPPFAADAPLLKRMAGAGLVPGQAVHLQGLDLASFALGRWIAHFKVQQALSNKAKDGRWTTPPMNLGAYGTDYNTRAAVAMVGLGANLPQDATYPNTNLDHQGNTLSGKHRYRLHFKAQALPPVKAFWSVTAYGADEFLIDNPIKRYALGDRDALHYNADGSLDIWIQAQAPKEAHRHANWLPVHPDQPFLLNARLYWPKEDALQGRWQMPAIERLD